MKSFSGLVRYEDLEELMLSSGATVFMRPFMPIDDLCLVNYDYQSSSIEYATLDIIYCVTSCYYTIKACSPFYSKAYSYSNVVCVNCGEKCSRMSNKNFGWLICCNCDEHYDVFGYSADIIVEIFRDVELVKLFPRWRWMK